MTDDRNVLAFPGSPAPPRDGPIDVDLDPVAPPPGAERPGQRAVRGTTLVRNAVVTDAILTAIRAGVPHSVAAALAGVPPATFSKWRQRALAHLEARDAGRPLKPADSPYAVFWMEVEKASAHSESRLVSLIAVAAQRDWRAAAWMLERRFPERYAAAAAPAPASLDVPAGEDARTALAARIDAIQKRTGTSG